MGYSILELVLRALHQENFSADIAYPGQKYPQITEPVAAVHIAKVDRAKLTVTVEVNIICPASMGGTACEVEALRATEILRWRGAVCVQNACTYDGVSQVYVVPVLATFTGITEADSCQIGPGFEVFVNHIYHPYAISVSEEELPGYEAAYEMGESAPMGIARGSYLWHIQLEELIPAGSPETDEPAGAFQLKIVTDRKTEIYYNCRWTKIRREFTQDGLRRTRSGISMLREEVE